jgi:hypothetical protein
MSNPLEEYKPAASARTHLLLAALLWTVVGGMLLLFGMRWSIRAAIPYVWLLLALAIAAGVFKALFVLECTARRTIDRIRERGDGRCIGGFLSIRTWLFVGLMMLVGYLLRHSALPRAIVGLIYTAVGTALLVAARRLWGAWYERAGTA